MHADTCTDEKEKVDSKILKQTTTNGKCSVAATNAITSKQSVTT